MNQQLAWEITATGHGFHIVQHRGYRYPPSITSTWKREDGLEVVIDITVDEERGPIPMKVTISGPEGVGDDYRQPIPTMTRVAASAMEAQQEGEGPLIYRPLGPTNRTDPTRLQRVADLYNQAIAEGRRVAQFIGEKEMVSTKTAYGLISQARKAGLLPPSRSGPKRKARETP